MAPSATSLKCAGLEVWVEVGGVRAPVYGVLKKENNKVSAYIESKAGEIFTVHWKFVHQDPLATDLRVTAKVDGSHVQGYVYHANRSTYFPQHNGQRPLVPYEQLIEGPRLNYGDEIAPLTFGAIEMTDDLDEADSSEAFVKHLGAIEVEVARVFIGGVLPQMEYKAPVAKVVHEKAKKAMLSHQAGFGAAAKAKVAHGNPTSCTLANPYEPVHASFEIRYLSRDLLELKDLIPADELALAEENERLRKRVAELQGDADGPSQKKIKAEKVSATGGAKKSTFIDLTKDDDDDVVVGPKASSSGKGKVKKETVYLELSDDDD